MEMKKLLKGVRTAGSIIGVILAFCMLVVSVISVSSNKDFWMKQNDRYNLKDKLSLVSNDGYRSLYNGYISLLEGKDTEVYAVKKGNPEDYSNTYIGSGMAPTQEGHFWEFAASFDEKFFYTVTELEKAKGNANLDLNGKMCLQVVCPEASKTFEGIKLKDIALTDKDGNPYKLKYELMTVNKDNSVKFESISVENEYEFIPKSTSTKLRVYLLDGSDYSQVNVKLFASAIGEHANIELLVTYTDDLTSVGVAERVGPKEQLLTINEREQILNAGAFNKYLKIAAIILAIIAIVVFVLAVKKYKREGLLGLGFYTVVAAIVCCIIVNALLWILPQNYAFSQFFDFNEGSTSAIVMNSNFIKDISQGIVRFFDFLMIFPLFIGYLITKIGQPKKDENEDYLYQ